MGKCAVPVVDDELVMLRLSTSQMPEPDRVEAFREIFGRRILRIDMEPLGGSELAADMTLRAFSGFGMASGSLSPMRNRHPRELIDNDDLVLVIMQSGQGALEQGGHRIDVDTGHAVLTSNGEPATFTGLTKTRVVNLRFSRNLLAAQAADLGKALASPAPLNNAAVRLLLSYANALNEEETLATPLLRQQVAAHMHDLAALAIGAAGDAAHVAIGRGVRAARLHAIKADIVANIARTDLSIEQTALRHGITPRYVRKLLESDGTSFSEFVLAQRLVLAHRMLADPRRLASKISTIAYACGFSDLSYFNRCFRRRFNSTPSEVREQAEAERRTQ